jgi:hypothetical protein
MFHVELRRFPHVARAFNLTAEELDERIVKPWAAGAPVELDDRSWEPAKARLSIYEGPAIGPEEIGLGRGWATATRAGEDVTWRLLEDARGSLQRFKARLTTRMSLGAVVALAGESHPHARASDRLALAERAVWELLHEHRLTLIGADGPMEREQWEPVLLRWESWSDEAIAIEPRP